MRTGVFRTYPGHRSNRLYNPVSRSWYKRALNAQTKTSLSSPYRDAAGAGKIISISQAVFEGMQVSDLCIGLVDLSLGDECFDTQKISVPHGHMHPKILKGVSLGLSFQFSECLSFEFESFANHLQISKKII